jgi:DNA-binding NarL/FixJ family response regulator
VRLNVLLVEDDDDIRTLLRFCLDDDERCASVVEATSPQNAVHAAAAASFDVMLVDFMLTGGTAADCLPRLRRLQPRAWIVVYTANRAAAEAADVINAGADLLVEKMSVAVDDLVTVALSHEGPGPQPPGPALP